MWKWENRGRRGFGIEKSSIDIATPGTQWALLTAYGALQVSGYYWMLWSSAPLKHHISGLVVVWLGYMCTMITLAAMRQGFDRFSWLIVFCFAVVFRLQSGTAPPYLISDFERYLFDGRLLLAGINPYDAQPLLFPELGGPDVPRPEVKTIYPPLAQALFMAAVWLGDTLSHWRLMSLAPDLLGALVFAKILNQLNKPIHWVTLYLWSPLLLKEALHGAHLDGWTLLSVLLFIYFAQSKKVIAASFALSTAVLTKLIPLILFPVWIIGLTASKDRALAIGIALTTIAAGFVFFLPHHPFLNILVFTQNIQGYGILFNFLSGIMPVNDAKVVLYSVGGGIVAYRMLLMSRRDNDPAITGTELFFLLFIFSSMAFPWYLLLALPWVIVINNKWLMAFVAVSQINYYAHQLHQDTFVWPMLAAGCLGFGMIRYWRNTDVEAA